MVMRVIAAIETKLTDFESDEILEEVKPRDLISLFLNVISEFEYADLQYSLNDKGCLHIHIQDILLDIYVTNLDTPGTWTVWGKIDNFILSAELPGHIEASITAVMELNDSYPHMKFSLRDGKVFLKDTFYIRHGIGVLNIMDRIFNFICTFNKFRN